MLTRAAGWEVFFEDKVEANAAFAQLAEEDVVGPVLDDQHNAKVNLIVKAKNQRNCPLCREPKSATSVQQFQFWCQ